MKRLGATLAAVILLLALIKTSVPVHAQAQNGQGIQISPVLIDVNTEKGKTYNLKVTVTNVTAGDLVLKPQVNDFKAKDEEGTPEILFDNDSGTYSLRTWIGKLPTITLKPRQSAPVEITLNVPPNAEPGGHYGVVRFSGSAPGQDDSNVALSASVGVLILARVDGPITEDLQVEEFFASHNGKRSGIFQSSPITLTERIKNTGNIHLKPQGDAVVKDMFGKTVATATVNSDKRNILPDSIRRFEQTINNKWMFGRYTAHISLAYGTGGQVLTGSTSFWVIPYKLIIIICFVLLLIIFGGRYLLKAYNRRVIRRAGNSNKR